MVTEVVVTVIESVIVSETVNSANRHSESDAVAVAAFTKVIVLAVIEYGAVKNASIRLPLAAFVRPMVPCPRGSQSIEVAVDCIAHRRFWLTVTLLLNLASGSVPLVRSEADVVAIPPPEVPTST
jgi:hypothetical protein